MTKSELRARLDELDAERLQVIAQLRAINRAEEGGHGALDRELFVGADCRTASACIRELRKQLKEARAG